MDEIKHWWNLTKCLKTLDGKEINNCQMYYVQCCKQLSRKIELPKQYFGPTTMCSYCGSLWSKNTFQARIVSGKNISKSVKKLIKRSENKKISKFHSTLMKKSLKNKMNRVVIKCSVCLKSTNIDCIKPERPKILKNKVKAADISSLKRKKKKKVKDKTAGLNLSNNKSLNINKNKVITPAKLNDAKTPIKKLKGSDSTLITMKKSQSSYSTSVQKVKKMNLKKLNSLLNDKKLQNSRNNLSNFLQELY